MAAPDILYASTLKTGDSLEETNQKFLDSGALVKVLLEVQNFTKFNLTPHEKYIGGGVIDEWGVSIDSGKREVILCLDPSSSLEMIPKSIAIIPDLPSLVEEASSNQPEEDGPVPVVNQASTATGCWGTMSWKIGETEKVLILMYSIASQHKWIGFGICSEENIRDFSMEEAFKKMYRGEPENWFARQEYSETAQDLKFEEDDVLNIQMRMGSLYNGEGFIEIRPKLQKDLAPTLFFCGT